ncbi:MAG: 30S ribosomal protein S24e [Candidatus Poseidoniia archaeon]|jgi:ribosomal protein S24E|nr:30S ribosomal protein S24e [Candidatus Poseidoniia archaeon]MDP7665110.1 30S ribosomal protein S24e [Candidatus Poseidoniia archaeon]HJN31759.1 30S ribosomal protein S24e [Candidatus Poseidoniia archaeon]|tara:strand:+ start:112 stop:528 length:417 start_codon:yes stop_codon:yes gene_type:complete
MELEITEQNDNPLLNRQEVKLVIKHENDSTPRRNQVIKNLSEQLKTKRELVIIDHLKNSYGKTETHGYAKIYADKDSLTKIETKPSMKRHKNIDSHSNKSKTEKEPKAKEADDDSPEEEKTEEADVKDSADKESEQDE